MKKIIKSTRSELSEAAGVGAAMLAGVGCGDFDISALPAMGMASSACPDEKYGETQARFLRFQQLEDKLAQGGTL